MHSCPGYCTTGRVPSRIVDVNGLMKILCRYFFQVRAAAVFALGTLLKVRADGTSSEGADNDMDEDTSAAEQRIANLLLTVLWDGSPLVRAELAVGETIIFVSSEVQSIYTCIAQ